MSQFTCKTCGREHVTLRALRIHEAKHRREAKTPQTILKYRCPWCEMSTDHARGLSQHAKKTHGKNADELYVARFPDCRTTCLNCGKKAPLKNQDIGYAERCGNCSRAHVYATVKHTSWNAGLTKENDERMAKSAENMRNHYAKYGHHNTGKTKENDENVRLKSVKISQAKKGKKYTPAQTIAHTGRHSIGQEEAAKRFAALGFCLVGKYVAALSPVTVRCTTCNNESQKKLHVLEHGGRCHTCFPVRVSRWQGEIADYVKSLTKDVSTNDRNAIAPYELDIYVPSKNFAIECHGIYWHSNAITKFDPKHTEKKRLLARAAGISLLVIFEDEWRDKRNIVESMIRHRLGLSTSIGGRKLTLQHCKPSDVAQLLQDWHLEGYVNSSYALRLVTNSGDTVGTCTLRWARGSDRQVLEIARIAFRPGIHVQGGICRFIKEAAIIARKNGAKKLISYSDNRLGDGTGYAFAGMKLTGTTVPRFWWTDFHERYNRFKYRADKANGLTESQVARAAGVFKIYGCSNSRWELCI